FYAPMIVALCFNNIIYLWWSILVADLNYFLIAPQSPQLQIGTNFTATCFIKNTIEVTADDLTWKLANKEIPKDKYRKINDTALNVTILVTEETSRWLFCFSKKNSVHVQLNSAKYSHGIYLKKGYLPEKPKNLTCIAYQKKNSISSIIHCQWEPKHQQNWDFSTVYTVYKTYNFSTNESSADITTDLFPNFMSVDIWVEAENALGKVESEHLTIEANSLIKTNPPSHINIISENIFPRSLLLNWTRPIGKTELNLIYEVRFTSEGSQNWSYVPPGDTNFDIQSFRLQNLQPDTVYITQVRCKNERDGYWSEWSNNSSKRTPADKPTSKPDVWQMSESEASDGHQVIQDYKEKRQKYYPILNTILVTAPNTESRSKQITKLKNVHLTDKTAHIVTVIAFNSEGNSPEATLVIPEKEHVPAPVQKLKVSPEGGKLCVEWSAPNSSRITEYVVQWASHNTFDWQREKKNVRKANIKGNLDRFVRYNVSVYPLYTDMEWIGKPTHIETYLEQGAPLSGPSKIISKPGCTEAHLMWEEIPVEKQRGFITNYTIFYTDGTKTEAFTVPSDTFSYTLTNLARNTRYETWIMASNIKGSTNGSKHSFSTRIYAPGEIEGIVVAVSLCFLFVVVLAMLICIYKRDVIKKSFWPDIPNPGESTIGTWSPDYPVKAEIPSESCLSGISVLDVDVCDGKSVFEEDKSCLPLKKDKYMSEEHSSGIGGSSCMSSPRQSVSDSDEGGDMADTTASTVQYSSVVASSGYKGQTPSLQPQQAVFSRSESTQPLLESEEHPDMLPLEGSRQSQRFHHLGLSHCEGNSDNPNQLEMEAKALDFCPVEEDSEEMSADGQPDEWLASAPISSYMPQLGGYRQQ
uniref:Fibronectin type-III domain-containing protein n=1 Tax=Neogobius melanostomus TaxID=47308 RepID=A0A8C6S910_9GOBI